MLNGHPSFTFREGSFGALVSACWQIWRDSPPRCPQCSASRWWRSAWRATQTGSRTVWTATSGAASSGPPSSSWSASPDRSGSLLHFQYWTNFLYCPSSPGDTELSAESSQAHASAGGEEENPNQGNQSSIERLSYNTAIPPIPIYIYVHT